MLGRGSARVNDYPLDHYQQQEQQLRSVQTQLPSNQFGASNEPFPIPANHRHDVPLASNDIKPQFGAPLVGVTQGPMLVNLQSFQTTRAPMISTQPLAAQRSPVVDVSRHRTVDNQISLNGPKLLANLTTMNATQKATGDSMPSASIPNDTQNTTASQPNKPSGFYMPPIFSYGNVEPPINQIPFSELGIHPLPVPQPDFQVRQARFGNPIPQMMNKQSNDFQMPSGRQFATSDSTQPIAKPAQGQLNPQPGTTLDADNQLNQQRQLFLSNLVRGPSYVHPGLPPDQLEQGLLLARQPSSQNHATSTPVASNNSTIGSNIAQPKLPIINLNQRLVSTHQVPNCANHQNKNASVFNLFVCNEDREYPTMEIMRALEMYSAEHGSIELLIPQSLVWLYLNQHQAKSSAEQRSPLDSLQATISGSSPEEPPFPSNNYDPTCRSTIQLSQPRRAKNLVGQWKIIVNLPGYKYRGAAVSQMIRIEECSKPMGECSMPPISSPDKQQQSSSSVKSQCLQEYDNQRLLSWSESMGLHMDIFRVPTTCSCHITRL